MNTTMVFNAVITENNGGDINTVVTAFKSFESASKYLSFEYDAYKVKFSKFSDDDLTEFGIDINDEKCGVFHLWNGDYNYECQGFVCGCEVLD